MAQHLNTEYQDCNGQVARILRLVPVRFDVYIPGSARIGLAAHFCSDASFAVALAPAQCFAPAMWPAGAGRPVQYVPVSPYAPGSAKTCGQAPTSFANIEGVLFMVDLLVDSRPQRPGPLVTRRIGWRSAAQVFPRRAAARRALAAATAGARCSARHRRGAGPGGDLESWWTERNHAVASHQNCLEVTWFFVLNFCECM